MLFVFWRRTIIEMGRMRPALGILAEASRLLGECDNPEIHAALLFPWARHGGVAKVIISGGSSRNDHLAA